MPVIRKNLESILFPLLLLVLAQIPLAENLIWNICSSGATWNQWNYKNPGIQVKNWLKSVIEENEKCPSGAIAKMNHFGANFNFCFITFKTNGAFYNMIVCQEKCVGFSCHNKMIGNKLIFAPVCHN